MGPKEERNATEAQGRVPVEDGTVVGLSGESWMHKREAAFAVPPALLIPSFHSAASLFLPFPNLPPVSLTS